MSVGNLKTDGQKGNNFPWQLKMLQGIQGIITAVTASACCPPEKRSTNIVSATGAGSVPNGVYSLSIANVGNAAGTVEGVSVPAGVVINFSAELNNYLELTNYNATGTTFLITYLS
jgi:hypothetical protein